MHVVAVWACVVAACGASLSGLYGDSGGGQTVLRHALTSSERLQLEHEMLSLLGLRARPRAVSNLSSSASVFLLAVYDYKNHLPASGVAGFQLSARDRRAVDRSDSVVSFAGRGHHEGAIHHARGKILLFDVSKVPSDEVVITVELRLYKTVSNFKPWQSFTLILYQFTPVSKGQKKLQFVDAVSTSSDYKGWLVLNMIGPFTTWASFPESNMGLYLSVHLSNQTGREEQPEEMGIVVDNWKDGHHEPFMVAFLRTPLQRQLHIREMRRTDTPWMGIKRWNAGGDSQSFRTYRQSSPRHQQPFRSYRQSLPHHDELHWYNSSKPCEISNLHVNFSELHWDDWIIAPKNFNAFFCSGDCSIPINAHLYPTNHAIVQMLVHMNNTLKVPKPCCVPIKLAPLSILYYPDGATVTLRNYGDMIVKSCGCL